MRTSTPELWESIAGEAAGESPLWRAALRPEAEREGVDVFSPLCGEPHALGLETVYEGYLVHYGRPRLFTPQDDDTAILLGDYLYAHGLVRIAASGQVEAVRELAELISRCAHLRSEGAEGDGEAWAETAVRLGGGARRPRRGRPRAGFAPASDGTLESAAMDVLAALVPLADAATEGKKVILGMLITGLIFIAVIVLGETSRWLRRRRGAAH